MDSIDLDERHDYRLGFYCGCNSGPTYAAYQKLHALYRLALIWSNKNSLFSGSEANVSFFA
jgi:hypothetical protein